MADHTESEQEELVEEIVEVLLEDDEMKEESDELQQRNQSSGNLNTSMLQRVALSPMILPTQNIQQQPKNRQQTFGCMGLMPLDLSKFYGKKSANQLFYFIKGTEP